ncbi:hypothetical protein SAMD00019534_080100 [Acytostelium subglobosum LB1]|uniref:hypothetical protein n=1 Tax=Acytostelium subglobosum LB1 TaxID=1410327 RepID=UPI000644AEAA|nr:hypothetical protein SAMD00019534_080100 [Acytostelium subglobosum LB1]GAM24835.1 hypothetical protein SAMD00019534_080100 [Acytostelium subglobosum LB1]|eukprot:XP_012752504.1 hypothetical protein SAMD00019534_080100 [Acytostelium subglobosum LB1]
MVTFVVLTSDVFKETRTKAVRETWAKRAVDMGWRVFYYSETDMGSPHDTIATHESDASSLGNDIKQWKAWKHAQKCCSHRSDFYIKVDDDTYVNVERMEKMLLPYDPESVAILGQCIGTPWNPKPFCGGGAGIILPRGGLDKMMEWYENKQCIDYGHNDLTTSFCFFDNNVTYTLVAELYPEKPTVWQEMVKGATFHHLSHQDMYDMHQVFYGSERIKKDTK